jgi:hypothetical protein
VFRILSLQGPAINRFNSNPEIVVKPVSILFVRLAINILLLAAWTVISSNQLVADTLTNNLLKFVKEAEEHIPPNAEIEVGLFTPVDQDVSLASYGTRIRLGLIQCLESFRFTVRPRAATRITGTFLYDTESSAITISIRLEDKKNGPVARLVIPPFELRIADDREIIIMTHPTAVIPPQANARQLSEIAQQAVSDGPKQLKPATNLQGDGFLTDGDLPIAVRLLKVNPDAKTAQAPELIAGVIQPLKSQGREGEHYQLSVDTCFAIEVVNLDPDLHLAFELLVDGISSFQFSHETVDTLNGLKVPRHQYWCALPNSNTVIPGWFRDLKTSNAFVITPDKDSVAAGFPLNKIGTIQVIAYPAWPKDTDPPRKEFVRFSKKGVGQGDLLDVAAEQVELEIGVMTGSLSVQYSTIE